MAQVQPIQKRTDTVVTQSNSLASEALFVQNTHVQKENIHPIDTTNLKSLKGRVAPLSAEMHIDRTAKAIVKLAKTEKDERSYMIKIRELVAELLTTLHQISKKDTAQIEEMKKRHKLESTEAANLQRDLGASGLKWAITGFVLSFLPLLASDEATQKGAEALIQQALPKFGEMFSANIAADMGKKNQDLQLLTNDLEQKRNQSQSNSQGKQEADDLLKEVRRLFTESATRR